MSPEIGRTHSPHRWRRAREAAHEPWRPPRTQSRSSMSTKAQSKLQVYKMLMGSQSVQDRSLHRTSHAVSKKHLRVRLSKWKTYNAAGLSPPPLLSIRLFFPKPCAARALTLGSSTCVNLDSGRRGRRFIMSVCAFSPCSPPVSSRFTDALLASPQRSSLLTFTAGSSPHCGS